MESVKQIIAHTIGHIAYETLSNKESASVCGITSKGVFAVTPSREILFLTSQPYHGPLTINLHSAASSLQSLDQGSSLSLSSSRIIFDQADLEIQLGTDIQVWHPPKLTENAVSQQVLSDRCDAIEQRIEPKKDEDISVQLFGQIPALLSGARATNIAPLLKAFTGLIGYGTGLTPSGDDYICGLILAARAWHDTSIPDFPLQRFLAEIQQVAWQKTTTLSANLIACAAQGSADERILNCVRWLHEGEGDLNQIIKELRSYGSSSGFDALQGIIALIRSSHA